MLTVALLRNCQSARRLLISDVARSNLAPKNLFRSEARSTRIQQSESIPLRERILKPTEGTPFVVGKAALAGGSALGLASLCYYGLGLSNQAGAIDRAALWPEYVRERIRATFGYFGASIVVAASSAYAATHSPTIMRMASSGSIWAVLGTMAVLIGVGMVAQSIPYQPGFGSKQLAWLTHSALIGGIMAPLSVFGGPLLMRAAFITAGVIASLSTVAICAPSEKFLNMGAPLAMGFGAVFAATMATLFFPPTTAIGASLYSISIYGGLLLFSAFMLYDVQKIVRRAEHTPYNSMRPYDPVTNAMSVFMDTVNIFIRIVQVLAMNGNRKK